MTDETKTCEHCGGMVGEDGLAVVLPEEPAAEEVVVEAKPKRSFADAVAARKEA